VAARSASNDPLTFSCTCGQIQGHLDADVCRAATRTECFCRDCRAAELYFGQPDPAPGAVDILQTTPDKITIAQGADKLGLFRLGPNGVLRWYATCCNAPLFNTLKSPKLPFAGILVKRLNDTDRIGPVTARNAIPKPDGSTTSKGLPRAVFSIFANMLGARLSGRWRQTPFFDVATGKPVREAVIPSKEDRAKLYPS
jgi:uncharacterized protein DUF6151